MRGQSGGTARLDFLLPEPVLNTSHILFKTLRSLTLALLLGICFSAFGNSGAATPLNNDAHNAGLCALPTSLDFGKVGLRVSSAPASVTITNCGKAKIVVDKLSITDSHEFTTIDSCPHQPLVLAPGASCTAAVRFSPDVEGLHQGDLLISSEKNKINVHLAGTGVATATTLSTTHVVFLPQIVGTQGKPGYVTIRNSSTERALRIDSVKVEGNFVLVPGILPCVVPGELPASRVCSLGVAFTPHTSGSLEGRLIINDSDPASPHVIALNGIATGIEIAPLEILWDRTVVGATAEPKEFTIRAIGEQAIQIENIKTRGDFEQKNTCGKQLSAGTSCRVTVTFKPTESGKRVGSVSLIDSDPTKAQSVLLVGWGSVASLLPSVLAFQPQAMGTTSLPQTVTLKNYGTTPITISSINVSGDFAVPAKTCAETLQGGQSCTLSVSFSPTRSGAATGFVAVDESGDKTPIKITLTGAAAESVP